MGNRRPEVSRSYVEAEYNYTYDDTDTTASTKVTSHSSSFISDSYTHSRTDYYEYDASGNITGIYRYVDGVKTYYYSYEYDEAGQLVRENILEDNKTILYIYDPGGNILAKGEFDYTLGEITEDMSPKSGCYYEYNNTEWKDQLTQFEYYDATSGGDDYIISDLTYDAAGNVASFNGQTYIWNANRQLESATNSEEQQLLRYSYNENGYLTRVDIYEDNGATFVGTMGYVWDGDKLISRCIVDYQTGENITARVIYDTDGEAIGTTIEQDTEENDTDEVFLLYRKNLQGDVTGLIDPVSGQLVASYTYDAYGYPSVHPVNDKPLSVLSSWLYISLIPQMYRGYIYTFVGGEICYYLGSRFYSPQLGRFLNADKHFDTGTGVLGTNVFAYCNNNPVMYTDPTGEVLSTISKLLNAIVKVITAIKKVFIKEVSYGAAKPFTGDKRPNVNCYAYAIGVDEARNPNNNPNITDFSLSNIIRLVELDFKTKLKPRKIRQLKNIDSKIESDEYRIALRTGSHIINGKLEEDYHFMVQHDDGSWSHKPGLLEARKLKTGETPETASWDLYEFVNNKVSVAYVNFYDSKTVYFAVTW